MGNAFCMYTKYLSIKHWSSRIKQNGLSPRKKDRKREEGRKEGKKEGRKEGRKEGKKEGRK